MRLSDAGLRQRQTKALDLNHRLPPWLTEDATPRSLEPIVRCLVHAVVGTAGSPPIRYLRQCAPAQNEG
jgi:hypothetical protein